MKALIQPQILDDSYQNFLQTRLQQGCGNGFEPIEDPKFLFDFQHHLFRWALNRGRSAIFADCGLGKTPISLAWAKNVSVKTGLPVLILTPLAVAHQFVREGEKFGIHVRYCKDREVSKPISVTNYERLHLQDPSFYGGIVCDESSILKNFSGKTRRQITEFMRVIPYRLLCTATAAPNDYIEFGTSSEAIGELGYMDMLSRFFKHDSGGFAPGHGMFSRGQWRFRGHSEKEFWRWLVSWSRAIRKPSDLGFSDGRFKLPQLKLRQYVVSARSKPEGMLFELPAMNLHEQRGELRRTVKERCEKAAELSDTKESIVCWCNLNDESKLLRNLIPDAIEIRGDHSDDKKEEAFAGFESGSVRVLITKPTIAGFGLNWQHCAHQIFFPSHSFEQWYQATRRSWRFGQTRDVTIDIVTTEGQSRVLQNLQRKAIAADKSFSNLVTLTNDALSIDRISNFSTKETLPIWLS